MCLNPQTLLLPTTCVRIHVCRREWFITEPSPWQVPLLGLAQGPISSSSAAAANNPLAFKTYARRTTLTGGSGAGAAGLKVASLSAGLASGGAASKAPTSPKSTSKTVGAAAAAAAGVHAHWADASLACVPCRR